jgi:hypothetical protein
MPANCGSTTNNLCGRQSTSYHPFACCINKSHNCILYHFQWRSILIQWLQDNNNAFSEHDYMKNLLIAFNFFFINRKEVSWLWPNLYMHHKLYISFYIPPLEMYPNYFFVSFVFGILYQCDCRIILNKSPNRTVSVPLNNVYDWNDMSTSRLSSCSILIYSSTLKFQ